MGADDRNRIIAGLGERVAVIIEVPKGGFVKRRPSGEVDFVSPLPCPYNYGSIIGTLGDDGDPIDAVVLGARAARGTTVQAPVRAVMGFVDAGVRDLKVVCSARPLSAADRRGVALFFRVYATFKRVLYRIRGTAGQTRCTGWEP